MKKLSFIFFFLFVMATSGFSQELSIQIIDAKTQSALPDVHIMDSNGKMIAFTSMTGYFYLQENDVSYPLMVHRLGYTTKRIYQLEDGEVITLLPTILESENEIVVNGVATHHHSAHHYQHQSSDLSMDQFLSSVDGIDMIQRGAFAWEPSIRGQSDQRLNIMIDGMAVFKACVDKMDPITSYVDVNNLSSLKVDKIGSSVAQTGNGLATINLETESPFITRPSLEFESNYKAPNNLYLFRISTSGSGLSSRMSYRISGSYRKSDDIIAGNSVRIDNSRFEKWNFNIALSSMLNDRLSIETNYITDKAFDVGYPALLMDATSAFADILRVQLNIKENDGPFNVHSLAVYANFIRHTMDDNNRDVSSRAIMRDMNMPMYGETLTFGLNTEGTYRLADRNFKWYLNSYRSTAFGDMEMISTLPNIADMYIYNLNDVVTLNSSLGFEQNVMVNSDFLINLEQSLTIARLSTQNDSYAAFFEGTYQRELSESVELLPSASVELIYLLKDGLSLKSSSVYSMRMGNHIEQYGHYIYNYADGFFYNGNPWIKNEQAISTELALLSERENLSFSTSAFARYYFDYIDGFLTGDTFNQGLQFKRYDNIGDAVFLGGEFRGVASITQSVIFDHRMSYVYAQNITIDEALPLIPPLSGSSSVQVNISGIQSSLIVDWATKQSRISTSSMVEDVTDGFAVYHLSFSKKWRQERITTTLNFRNLTDELYHTHTSIGNIPSEGFSVMAGLSFNLN